MLTVGLGVLSMLTVGPGVLSMLTVGLGVNALKRCCVLWVREAGLTGCGPPSTRRRKPYYLRHSLFTFVALFPL